MIDARIGFVIRVSMVLGRGGPTWLTGVLHAGGNFWPEGVSNSLLAAFVFTSFEAATAQAALYSDASVHQYDGPSGRLGGIVWPPVNIVDALGKIPDLYA